MYLDRQIRRISVTVAASQTDAILSDAVSGMRLRVLDIFAVSSSATPITFNSMASGSSGVAITQTFTIAAGEPLNPGFNPHGWFDTYTGESLTVTTGSGAATEFLMTVAIISGVSSEGLLGEDGTAILTEDGQPLMLESA